ncbi:DENN domain-containing protein 5B [Tribolium castaneum]|uniref:DENN domain-containing protein 5B-like Protein n=1 Tax=Tribolium castaneum TaxID=7070 RepID=D2A1W8_TRICA|nr:PREDICTED: DENN domain-containing protein 5B [Tribolium castaneum]EFA02072.1 DENN domain-containing protein 5B-like Protein [Tribolium castaneum]|eukprot:XP_008191606.1 PREDICTED: DENN domain-containing protein 5B [Tribolium castaneum]
MAKFADYFVICGLDLSSGLEPDNISEDNLHVSPLERSYKGKVLAHYPENVSHNSFDASAVCMFCLPQGLKFRTQKHSVTQAPVFHSFLITREDGKRCYGFSLIFYEEVRNRDICNAMQTLQAMYITELSSGLKVKAIQNTPQSRSLPRHFKLSTHNPSGAALTYYDISKDKLFVSKSISLICQTAYVQAAKIFLENLFRCVPKRAVSSAGLSLESYVFNLIYEVQLPAPGKSLLISLPPSDPHLPPVNAVLQSPAPPLELPHLDYSLRLLFIWLGVDIVIQIFTCLLLENQVLLRSTDCQRLMVVAEGITSLLFPFTWPHVYVPILPASLHHFLDAPVPFVMGLYASSENIKVASEATLCYVDIDKCKVQRPEESATFPHLEAFTDEIWAALDKYGVHVPNSENSRSQEIMSRSCTLPGRPQNRRKLSIHDTLDGDRPPSPPGSARSEALQRIADIVRRTGVALDQNEATQPTDSYIEDLRFNNSIREIFLNRFVHIFQSYENFVIFPNQDKDDWFNNRDSMQNFDKASFLSDQPEQHRHFLWRFLESQMFATLIDNKILSTWGELDNNLIIFDNRIKLLKQRYGGENLIRSLCYEPCTSAHDTQKLLERRLTNPDFEAPPPREIMNVKSNPSRYFPLLDKEVLNKTPVVNKGSIPRASALRKGLSFTRNLPAEKTKNHQDMSPALIAQANWTFVEKLLKDCKAKTKRMLLAKLGAEGVTLSSNNAADNFGAVEENTLVASLCEFLERVWSHGLQRKKGKSALWSHLTIYQETQHQNRNKYLSESRNIKGDLPTLPDSLLFDIANVQAMTDVKTGIGMAKAWVRLALEKKQLSKHLRTLLSDQTILRSLYKRSAFLRCEEEKEQFLYHLLSLNAVDYFCFTSTYATTVIPYRIVIIPNKKGSTTSANAWVVLSGTLSETRRIPVPKSNNFEYKHHNLGVLTTLRIGHDNSGLYAKWMIDYVLVRNEITGHTYKFPCGRWLGRGVDDGSTERLLVGNLMALKVEGEETNQSGSMGRTPPRCPSPAGLPRTELKQSQIQHMLGDCVNNIVKWHYRRNSERNTTLTALLCGENGLVHCLENVFFMGFKSARLFVGKNHLWDYFVRVKEQFESDLLEESSGNRTASLERNHQETVAVWRCYCHLIDEIMCTSKALGKDGKFQLFICLSVREHLLHRMLGPMALCKVTQEMYEESSFLRNRGLLTFLRQILLPLDELDVVLENSVTHGISSPSSHV